MVDGDGDGDVTHKSLSALIIVSFFISAAPLTPVDIYL